MRDGGVKKIARFRELVVVRWKGPGRGPSVENEEVEGIRWEHAGVKRRRWEELGVRWWEGSGEGTDVVSEMVPLVRRMPRCG